MSKEEFLKIQTCVLKVNIHCDGCKQKVKKILQKIDGVYKTNIDSEQGKVTVSGNVDPATLIKKLAKGGKHAEIWGASKANKQNQQNLLNNQLKNMQISNGKCGNSKGQGQKGGNNQPKGGQQGQNQQQQLQQLQDLKLPQFKGLKMPPFGKDPNQKSVKFNLPEEGDEFDYEFDDEFDDDDDDFDDDEELDDGLDDDILTKMKPVMGNDQGGAQMPSMLLNGIMNGQHPQLMKGGNVGSHGGNGKKGGVGNVSLQHNGNGGKNGGGGNGNNHGGNQNQGGGGGGGGGAKNAGKTESGGAGGHNKNGNNGGGGGGANANINGNGGKKGGGMNDGLHGMPNMMGINAGGSMGQMGNLPMGQMGNVPAVSGLPAPVMNDGGGGHFPRAGAEAMAGNPYQQQLAAMMMNQQRANGNERFQPMMYARPPLAVNYMAPYPYPPPPPHADSYPYPRPPPHGDPYSYSYFSDENTSSCSVM